MYAAVSPLIPPPTIAMRFFTERERRLLNGREARQSALGKVGESASQGGRFVEGLGAFDAQPDTFAEFAESDVDVVKDFDMITEKADGMDDNGGVSGLA